MEKADRSAKTAAEGNLYGNYSYVGTKETVAYLFNDWSNAFNINGFKDRFVWDVVKIDFGVQAVVGLFTGIWDVINDVFISALVDNTRTRLGKFRPYLILTQIPLTLVGMIYWFLPYLFPNTAGTYVPKLIFYFLFGVITETAGTFTDVARAGYMSTVTPNPNERVRLITLAELLTGYMGEDMPSFILGILYDFVSTGRWKAPLRAIFVTMGAGCAAISCAFTFWFFVVSKERVPQTVERPDLKRGFLAIVRNYPVLLMTLSDFFGHFAVGMNERDYWIDVHGADTMINSALAVAGLVSGPVGSVSYAFVQPLRKRFSSKFLWVGADIWGDALCFLFFAVGMIGNNYRKLKPMLIVYGFREIFAKLLFGVNKVINADLWNEAMDYCEWKSGCRMEATTGVAKSLVLKLQNVVRTSVFNVIMKKIGYVQGLKIGTQSEKTKRWEFILCAIMPTVTGALGIVPKLFWPITKSKREQMYGELADSRSRMVSDYVGGLE
ncbi:MAG: MFS transporter [Clostridia bacterium]|nr:MFS transporter [Clostridia bacterium]